jgi:hypothetical protein
MPLPEAVEGIAQAVLEDLIEGWQTKRDHRRRGVVEVIG